MRDAVMAIWPELDWIGNPDLRRKTLDAWVRAFELSPLTPEDLEEIPFTLLIPNCPVSFMAHKRAVVHIAKKSAETMKEFFGDTLPIDPDTVIAGAILADVGKLLEYEKVDGKAVQSDRGKALRHPFTGVHLAMACGLPDSICHIVATHAGEGNLVKRSPEAWVVHHADFMAFEPFKTLEKK